MVEKVTRLKTQQQSGILWFLSIEMVGLMCFCYIQWRIVLVCLSCKIMFSYELIVQDGAGTIFDCATRGGCEWMLRHGDRT
jgi:hypothetical protein